MLLVKTKVAPSLIEGNGLFADEFIPAGTHIWKYVDTFDRSFTPEHLADLSEPARSFVRKYAYVSPVSGNYILCSDNSRFFNHADKPNTGEIKVEGEEEPRGIALRDIQSGEELTIDYRVMEGTEEPIF